MRELVKRLYPDAEAVKIKKEHGVFVQGDRIIKLQSKKDAQEDVLQSMRNEYAIYERTENKLWTLNPVFKEVDGWEILEMDLIKGELIDDIIKSGRMYKFPFAKVYGILFKLSILGIQYKQFRLRHIFECEDKNIVFFDFGRSRLGNPFIAFFRNFAFFQKEAGKLRLGRAWGILKLILFRKSKSEELNV